MPSKSLAQHNLMAAVANNPAFAKKTGIPKSVGEEFVKADKRKAPDTRAEQQAINRPKTNHGAGSLFNRGGDVKESKGMMKKEIAFMEKKGAPKSMIKHEKAEMGEGKKKFADGGMPMMPPTGAPGARKRVDPRAAMLAARMAGAGPRRPMPPGAGMAPPMRPPTMMSKGGFTKSADGVATKGKTKATQVKMTRGGKC